MDRRLHFIWGSASCSKNRVLLLKMHGMDKVFVLDKYQKTMIQERKDATYVSMKYVPLFRMDQPGRVHHFFASVPPENYRGQIKKK